MSAEVAALYIDPRGPYPKLLGPELCWDEKRDARAYAGPWPVVAHPPCGPWSGKVRKLYKGAEHECAPRAIEQVRRFGGALEHPAYSKLWDALLPEHIGRFCAPWLGLREPQRFHTDEFGGYCLFVAQVEFGHVARKPTWLYLVGVPRAALTPPPFRGREPTHWCGGGRTPSSRTGSPIPAGKKAASSQQKRRTPPAFAEWLISLAKQARRP